MNIFELLTSGKDYTAIAKEFINKYNALVIKAKGDEPDLEDIRTIVQYLHMARWRDGLKVFRIDAPKAAKPKKATKLKTEKDATKKLASMRAKKAAEHDEAAYQKRLSQISLKVTLLNQQLDDEEQAIWNAHLLKLEELMI